MILCNARRDQPLTEKNASTPQRNPPRSYLLSPLLRHTQDLLLAGLLDEGDDPEIGWIGPGVELDANVLRELGSGRDAADFRETLHYAYVSQAAAAVFTAQHLRLSMMQCHDDIDFSFANLGSIRQGVGVDVCVQRLRGIERDPGNQDRNLRQRQSLQHRLVRQVRIV